MMTFEQMQAIVEGMLQSQQQLTRQQEQLSQQQEQLSQRHEQLSQRHEEFHEKIQQEINMFLASLRELQESDLRRQSELQQASQGRAETSRQIQGLTLIAERLIP